MAGYTLSATLVGADVLRKALANGDQFAKQELANALNKAANDLRQRASDLAPHDTGTLKNSIHAQNASPSNLVAKVGTNLKYASYQEYGTGLRTQYPGATPHLIVPINAKAMIMVGGAGSAYGSGNVFAWFKSSKGVHPTWYMKTAFETIRDKWSTYAQEACTRLVNDLSGK